MKGMTNNQIIMNEAAKLDPATLHAIATAHHTPEQIAAMAANASPPTRTATNSPPPSQTLKSSLQRQSCTPSITGRKKARASRRAKRI